MASWKVKGVVPDSDEEDDGDTRSLSEEGQGRNASHGFMADHGYKIGIQGVGSEDLEQVLLPQPPLGSSKVDVLSTVQRGRPISFSSSSSPPVFKHPPALISSQELPSLRDSQSKDQTRLEEEISRSYITLSSPLSSLPSSPGQSPFPKETEKLKSVSPQQMNTLVDPFAEEVGIEGSSSDFRSVNRRSLRERNPIQLHPYALEGEKYRRTLLARGMRPLRLAQAQDVTATHTWLESSPDPEAVSEESQNLVDEVPPSQSPSHTLLPDMGSNRDIGLDNPDPSIHSDDDEFPEIGELLPLQHGSRAGRGLASRMTTYGARFKSKYRSKSWISPCSARLNNVPEAFRFANSPRTTVSFSPPIASSPTAVFNAPGTDPEIDGVPSFNVMSCSSTPVEEAAFDLDEIAGDLPKPAGDHPAKQIIDLTVDELNENDSFASDTNSEAGPLPSEDAQSMQVRRAAKKIRGVLPASWIRLDQQTQNGESRKHSRREERSPSPWKAPNLRGVAVRRHATSEKILTESRIDSGSDLPSDDTDRDDDPSVIQDIGDGPIRRLHWDRHSSPFDNDSIMEDDHIDAMLPAQTKLFPDTTRRKRRAVFQRRIEGRGYQPKITSHLRRPRRTELDAHIVKRRKTIAGDLEESNRATKSRKSRNKRQIAIPNLSILDVLDRNDSQQSIPTFLRIAARNARLRGGLGRHSPTRKFIRLAEKDDTLEAQSTLQKWREGSIRPKPHTVRQPVSRTPLAEVLNHSHGGGTANHISSTAMTSTPLPQPEKTRKIATATFNQSRSSSLAAKNKQAESRILTNFSKQGKDPKMTVSTARPAQLETSLLEYGQRHPNVAFGSTKKTLDTLYKRAHKGSAVRGDVQLARFLGQDSRTQVERVGTPVPVYQKQTVSVELAEKRQRHSRRKQVPTRIDVNAATYRQPSEPLILELLQAKPETYGAFSNPGKLAGLSGFSTTYTYHFDIFPLQEGVFFHESTFIGSGRLKKALEIEPTCNMSLNRGHLVHRIGDKNIRWGRWNASVSSELGQCIDWIVEQIEVAGAEISTIGARDILDCLNFIIDYNQSSLSFHDETERKQCLCRFIEVLENLVERLKMLAERINVQKPISLQLLIELSARVMILVFQLLQLSYLSPLETEIGHRFDRILRITSAQAVALLLEEGFGPIRKLYDDLQYLSVREGGIKADRYAAQSWVILIQVLEAAKLPQLSFWGVVNPALFAIHDIESNDAKVLERVWYSMFSLLPLFDFDRTGVIVTHLRKCTLITDWALPQKLLKKMFELYDTKSRQSPSFSDYLQALFSRCSHLMQTWGWRKQGLIVGTLFDFFARHKLANLRNEEVYESPRFLEELSRNPSLDIEPSDRCFHILLKIIAVSIKQMRASEDVKGIRNIITRVLPNHDRQYPKEQTIHQKDLASLRNHHDLLCTLFWAAPLDLRPAVDLIRRLIDPATSHSEAYLIHLHAWHNLARFVLASTPTPAAYLPLDIWQSDLFSQLILQYQATEKDVEQQLRQLSSSAKHLVSEKTLLHVVETNQNHIMACLLKFNKAVKELIETAKTMDAAKLVFLSAIFQEYLVTVTSCFAQRRERSTDLAKSTLDIIDAYISKLNKLIPPTVPNAGDAEEDSQDYGDHDWSAFGSPRWDYIGELDGNILEAVRKLLRTVLREDTPCVQLIVNIATTWANIAGALIMTNLHTLPEWISDSGVFNEIGMDDGSSLVRDCYGHFLVTLVNAMDGHFKIQEMGRDALSDWLSFLVKPVEWKRGEDTLLTFFATLDPVLQRIESRFKEEERLSLNTAKDRDVMILAILREMQKEIELQPANKTRYQAIFHRILATIKREIQDLDPGISQAKGYTQDVETILRHLTTYFRDLCPIDDFFKANSLYPSDDDPEIFLPTLRSYALRLNTSRGKSELNHYCFGFAKHAAVEGGLKDMVDNYLWAMNMDDGSQHWAELADHFLTVLAPAFTHPAFVSDCGWLLAEPFLDVAIYQLQFAVASDISTALRGATAIASTLINGIWLFSLVYEDPPVRPDLGRLQHSATRTLVLATRFMIEILKWTKWMHDEPLRAREELMDYLALFNRFALGARDYLISPIRAIVRNRLGKTFNDSSLTESLIISYASFGPETIVKYSPQSVLQNNALRALASHCVGAGGDIDWAMQQLRSHYNSETAHLARRNPRDGRLFEGLREAASSDEGIRRLKLVPSKEMPEFSAVIVQDMHDNWKEGDESEIRILFGRKTGWAAKRDSTFGYKKHNKLWHELNNFLSEYQRMTAPAKAVLMQDRKLARSALDFDESPF